MTTFWLIFWACALAGSWLLPNHYLPWPAFHTDAWCAAVLLAGVATIAIRLRHRLSWHVTDVAILGLLFLPPLQYTLGLLYFSGQAVVASAYLFGLLMATLTGARWEQGYPGQVMNGLFTAIGIAAVVSVSLQLRTWLNLVETGMFDIWSMGLSGARPYANLGQPNQLATLLIWGVLASAWAFNARVIGAAVAILMAAFLLAGVALTQSRTAWIGLIFLVACSWCWRSVWRSNRLPWVACGLLLYFCICYFYIHSIGHLLGVVDGDEYFRGGLSGDLRLSAWRIFAAAALEKPWFGYGWSEVGRAQFAVAQNFPLLFPTFGHSHNLFVDLVLWLGIPLGVVVSFGLVTWYVQCLRAVKSSKDALLVMLLGAVGIHAMLEFPLHYAYFLLPVGIVVGVLNQRALGLRVGTTSSWLFVVGWIVAALLLAGIVRDYFKIESSFQEARYEAARIGTLPVGKSPDVLLLTQLRDNIDFMRYEVRPHMAPAELEWLKSVVIAYPSGGRVYKVAKALVLNGQPEEAIVWLRKVCRISSPEECALIKRVWLNDAKENAAIAAVPWPLDN